MERWCQQINVHYFCFETALFGKIFGHMCKEKICVPPPPSGGWLRRKNCMPFPEIFFFPPLVLYSMYSTDFLLFFGSWVEAKGPPTHLFVCASDIFGEFTTLGCGLNGFCYCMIYSMDLSTCVLGKPHLPATKC